MAAHTAAFSISDIGSQMSPYISGDAIPFGFAPTGAAPTWLLGKGADESGTGGVWLNISNVATTIAHKLGGSQIEGYQDWATQYKNLWTGSLRSGHLATSDYILAAPTGTGPFAAVSLASALTGNNTIDMLTAFIVSRNGSQMGASIGGYGSYSDTETGYMHILAGGSSASLRTGAPAKWLHMGRLGSAIGGYGSYASDATGTAYMYVLAGSIFDVRQGSAAKWLDIRKMGDHIGGYSQNAEDETQTHVLAGDGGTGIPGWTTISGIGSQMSPYIQGSQISFPEKMIPGGGYVLVNDNSSGSGAAWTPVTTLGERIRFASGGGSMILAGDGDTGIAGWMAASNLAQYIPGSQITGYGSNSGSMILAGNGGSAGWMNMTSLATTLGSLIGSKLSLSPANSGEYVAVATGGSGNIAGLRHVSALSQYISGTLIGTVNGSQVKIEQTATAAELQAKTGTIYFPVVQDGKIYGVTLNDFYILMNAQF